MVMRNFSRRKERCSISFGRDGFGSTCPRKSASWLGGAVDGDVYSSEERSCSLTHTSLCEVLSICEDRSSGEEFLYLSTNPLLLGQLVEVDCQFVFTKSYFSRMNFFSNGPPL